MSAPKTPRYEIPVTQSNDYADIVKAAPPSRQRSTMEEQRHSASIDMWERAAEKIVKLGQLLSKAPPKKRKFNSKAICKTMEQAAYDMHIADMLDLRLLDECPSCGHRFNELAGLEDDSDDDTDMEMYYTYDDTDRSY